MNEQEQIQAQIEAQEPSAKKGKAKQESVDQPVRMNVLRDGITIDIDPAELEAFKVAGWEPA